MKELKINKNISSVKLSATLAINQQVKIMRSNGRAISHFGFGESPFPVPEQMLQNLSMQIIKTICQVKGCWS